MESTAAQALPQGTLETFFDFAKSGGMALVVFISVVIMIVGAIIVLHKYVGKSIIDGFREISLNLRSAAEHNAVAAASIRDATQDHSVSVATFKEQVAILRTLSERMFALVTSMPPPGPPAPQPRTERAQ